MESSWKQMETYENRTRQLLKLHKHQCQSKENNRNHWKSMPVNHKKWKSVKMNVIYWNRWKPMEVQQLFGNSMGIDDNEWNPLNKLKPMKTLTIDKYMKLYQWERLKSMDSYGGQWKAIQYNFNQWNLSNYMCINSDRASPPPSSSLPLTLPEMIVLKLNWAANNNFGPAVALSFPRGYYTCM